MKALRYLFLFFSSAFCLVSFSQKQQIQFEHIGTSLGLSQSNVICIFQDSRGFMWFGTRDGLNKYDGYKFTLYKNEEDNVNSLSHNTVYDIAEDADGNLWIATWGGLDMFDRAREKFVRHRPDVKNTLNGVPFFINSIVCSGNGNLWIGTEGYGLQQYDIKSNHFTSYTHHENDPKSLGNNFVKKLVEDSKHNLWISTIAGGLSYFDTKTAVFTHFTHNLKNPQSIASDSTGALFIDHQNQLWIGLQHGGLELYDQEEKIFHHFTQHPADNTSLSSEIIRTINEDAQGNLWLGTEHGGLRIFHVQSGIFDKYVQDEVDNKSISDNSVWSLCKDNSGNMWAGTFNGGVNFINRNAYKFNLYHHTSSPFSLSNNHVTSILEDSKENCWIATDGGGVNLFDRKKGIFTHYLHEPLNPKSMGGNNILKIFEDSKGDLWIGTWGQGITVFNKEKNTFTHFKYDPLNAKGLGGNNAWTICEDADKNIWIGFYNGSSGIDRYDRKNNNFVHYKNDPGNSSSLSNNVVNTIFIDKQGKLWVATNGGGLDLFDKKNNSFTHITSAGNNSISNNEVYCLLEDAAGNLWIGTHRGLNRMDKKTGIITKYFKKDGLPSNTVSGILADEKGNLWISTYNGLSRFDTAGKSFKNFSVTEGLQSNEFNINSCFKSRSGKMYFGGLNGFNAFFPDEIKEKNYRPPLVFTDFQISNTQVAITDSSEHISSPLKKSISETKEIILPYSQFVISFDFASLNYAAGDKKQYSYMLVGFDKDWNNTGAKHSATYTNLAPDKYVLKVRTLDSDGKWSSTVSSIQLTITPPFWMTWWFRLIILISITVAVIVFINFRTKVVRAQKIKLQQKVQEQTQQLRASNIEEQKARREAEKAKQKTDEANKELEQKNTELEQFVYIASHDLQEPLRTTTSFVELLQRQYQGQLDEKADKYFNFITDASARMKTLIKDLLDYSKIGAKKEFVTVDCNVLLKEVMADLGNAINEAHAVITADPLPVITGYATEMKQLFQNLLINAVKFRKKDIAPDIKITVQHAVDHWLFAVKDNGIGIAEQYKEKIFLIFQRLHTKTDYEGSGIGLAHSKKIVELHGGKIWIESQLGEGTSFYFTIFKNSA